MQPARDIVRSLDKGTRWLTQALNYLAIASLALMAIMVIMHVIMRYVFKRPLSWGEEVAMALMMVVTLAAVPWLFRDNGHLVIDVITQRISRQARRITSIIIHIVGILFLSVWCWYAIRFFLDVYRRAIHYNTMQDILVWPEYLFTALMLAISALVLLINLLGLIIKVAPPTEQLDAKEQK